MRRVLKYVRDLLAQVTGTGEYSKGYRAALEDVEEFIEEELWEEGEEA